MFTRPAPVSGANDSERCLDYKTWEISRTDSGHLTVRLWSVGSVLRQEASFLALPLLAY